MLVVFPHIHRLHRLKAAKDGEQAMSSPLNLPRSSFAAAVAAKKMVFGKSNVSQKGFICCVMTTWVNLLFTSLVTCKLVYNYA